MAKLALKLRDQKRRRTVEKFKAKRAQLLDILHDARASDEAKAEARDKLRVEYIAAMKPKIGQVVDIGDKPRQTGKLAELREAGARVHVVGHEIKQRQADEVSIALGQPARLGHPSSKARLAKHGPRPEVVLLLELNERFLIEVGEELILKVLFKKVLVADE